MINWMAPIAASLLLLAGPSLAASQLEASRQSATAARQALSKLRSEQMSLRGELNQLASRIEALKAERQGKLLPGDELSDALRRSQELSGSLTSLAQSVAGAEASLERENLALLPEISAELSWLRSELDRRTDRQARRELIGRMRSLREEREQVRAMLPAAAVPALESAGSADDPEDLLEQVDALRDVEDKVRRELLALETRISEKREERELDRRMGEFLGDESVFDEQDRRFRLRQDSVERQKTTTTAAEPPQGGRSFAAAPKVEASSSPGEQQPPPADDPSLAARDLNQNEKAPGSPSVEETFISRSARASDARPIVGQSRPDMLSSLDDSLQSLERERARLKGLVEELKLRARKLEDQAQSLK